MSDDRNTRSPLVDSLLDLAAKQDRAALAALRSGKGKRPGEAARMFPYVVPYLGGSEAAAPQVQAAFLTAALFAFHPLHGEAGSLGASLRMSVKTPENPGGKHAEEGVEARFVAALEAHPDDLPRHLEGLVSLCESAGVPVDWYSFQSDVAGLLSEWTVKSDPRVLVRDRIRLRWARDFWRGPGPTSSATETEEEKQQ